MRSLLTAACITTAVALEPAIVGQPAFWLTIATISSTARLASHLASQTDDTSEDDEDGEEKVAARPTPRLATIPAETRAALDLHHRTDPVTGRVAPPTNRWR